MSRTLHIIAACTDRKHGDVAPIRRFSAYREVDARAEEWSRALRSGASDAVCAEDLYAGDHWSVAKALPARASERGWEQPKLWAASAGYGLLAASAKVVPYAATFAPRHADSVVDPKAGGPANLQVGRWWEEFAKFAPRGAPARIADLARQDPHAGILVVASPLYIDAIAHDLEDAMGKLAAPNRVVVVTSKGPRVDRFAENAVIAEAALRGTLAGSLTSLHARLARHLLSALTPSEWSAARAQACAAELLSRSVVPTIPSRQPMSDDDLRAFVRDRLNHDEGLSATRLLRELRDGGRACEQARFKGLFHSVRGSRGA